MNWSWCQLYNWHAWLFSWCCTEMCIWQFKRINTLWKKVLSFYFDTIDLLEFPCVTWPGSLESTAVTQAFQYRLVSLLSDAFAILYDMTLPGTLYFQLMVCPLGYYVKFVYAASDVQHLEIICMHCAWGYFHRVLFSAYILRC